ncbi:hypothetical protein [Aerococcus urinaeequi]|uniref:hypothetical protein n=1 Tax=Aerococcus urinaeequi TaxID=51665 RepID=UPI003D6BDEA5
MDFLFSLFFLGIGFIIVGLIWLIVNLIKKRNKIIPIIIMIFSVVISIGSFIGLNHVNEIDYNKPVNTTMTLSKLRGQGGEYEEGTFDMDDTLYDANIIDDDAAVILNGNNTLKGFYVYQSSDPELYEILEALGFPIDEYLTDFITDDEANTYIKSYDNYSVQISEYPSVYGDYYENELSVIFYEVE